MFKLTKDGTKYTARTAKLYLSDYAPHGGEYNHPELSLTLEHPSGDDWYNVGVCFKFQRDNKSNDAESYMDTARAWSHSYGGHVELSDADRFDIRDIAHTLRREDKIRIAVARKIAKHVNKCHLYAVHKCHTMQIVAALREMGVAVEVVYLGLRSGERYSLLSEMPGSQASQRARAAEVGH